MFEILIKIVPVILIFLTGYISRKIGLFSQQDADLFLKVVFYISLPALILLSVTKIELSPDFIYLPLISVLIILTTFSISYVSGWLFRLPKSVLGVFLTGTMIMNIGFVLPFFIAAYGEEGLARASLFDFGNGLLTFTFVYYFACRYGDNSKDSRTMIGKFVLAPPIWALLAAIILNLSNQPMPTILGNFFQTVGSLTIPLVMLSLGLYFKPTIVRLFPLSAAIIIRMLVGLALGFIFVGLFNLEGLNRLIVIISSAAPIGYNTLTFSSIENLDKEFAASLVSFSILIGIISVPILIVSLT